MAGVSSRTSDSSCCQSESHNTPATAPGCQDLRRGLWELCRLCQHASSRRPRAAREGHAALTLVVVARQPQSQPALLVVLPHGLKRPNPAVVCHCQTCRDDGIEGCERQRGASRPAPSRQSTPIAGASSLAHPGLGSSCQLAADASRRERPDCHVARSRDLPTSAQPPAFSSRGGI